MPFWGLYPRSQTSRRRRSGDIARTSPTSADLTTATSGRRPADALVLGAGVIAGKHVASIASRRNTRRGYGLGRSLRRRDASAPPHETTRRPAPRPRTHRHASRRAPCCSCQHACHGLVGDEWPHSGQAHGSGWPWAARRLRGGPGHAAHRPAASCALRGLRAAQASRHETSQTNILCNPLCNAKICAQFARTCLYFPLSYFPLSPAGAWCILKNKQPNSRQRQNQAKARAAGQQQPGRTE